MITLNLSNRKQYRWLVLCLALSQPALALETVNSATLSAAALAPSCLRYRIVGSCFYLSCGFFSCSIKVSVKVAHFNPDVVVSAYNSLAPSIDPTAGNPWTEAKLLTGSIETVSAGSLSGLLGGIDGLIPTGGTMSHGMHQNLLFKEADAFGHPLASATGLLARAASGLGLICPSDATSFKPYFLSGFDVAAWRWGIPELVYPQAWVPGLREIGRFPVNTWGQVYPRAGMLTQSDPAKMAAVIAQRVGDVITRSGQTHIYRTLGNGQDGFRRHSVGGNMVWSPGKLTENAANGGWWQMNSPKAESECRIFGENDLISATGWGGGRTAQTGNYTFTLWRPYQCCKRRGIFLGSVDFTNNIPPPNPTLAGNSPGNLGGLLGNTNSGTPLLPLPQVPKLPSLKLPF